MKRFLDIFVALSILIIFSPVLLIVMLLVWLQDFHSPFYFGVRVGKKGNLFKMVKMRSMKVNAEKSGVDSTAANDSRITKVGHFIRNYKIDELTQLWNVLWGQMSLVGPRPNVERDVALYTEKEKQLLSVRPGITDISSIVFADEGEILKGSSDPDLRYNQIIRPWKSRLGLLYIEKQSFILDVKILYLTFLTIISRQKALNGIYELLKELAADPKIVEVAIREKPLEPYPPPGSSQIVMSR